MIMLQPLRGWLGLRLVDGGFMCSAAPQLCRAPGPGQLMAFSRATTLGCGAAQHTRTAVADQQLLGCGETATGKKRAMTGPTSHCLIDLPVTTQLC